MDQLHTANKVCGGCCAISLNTVDTESSVSPTNSQCAFRARLGPKKLNMLKIFLESRRVSGLCLIRFEYVPRAL